MINLKRDNALKMQVKIDHCDGEVVDSRHLPFEAEKNIGYMVIDFLEAFEDLLFDGLG
jgi:hypothetical protein